MVLLDRRRAASCGKTKLVILTEKESILRAVSLSLFQEGLESTQEITGSKVPPSLEKKFPLRWPYCRQGTPTRKHPNSHQSQTMNAMARTSLTASRNWISLTPSVPDVPASLCH